MLALALILLTGCDDEPTRPGNPGQDFRQDTDVVITSHANGETVQSPFVLGFQAGADVRQVRLDVEGEVWIGATEVDDDGQGELTVALDPGRYRLTLVGLDGQEELSQYSITLRIAEEEQSWVTIVSPSDGATVPNPVTFAVDGSDDVEQIELFADGWSLGAVEPGQILTYEFTGTGFAREIEARGTDAGGATLATDLISLTVDPGSEPIESDFNAYVLGILAGYPTDGSYGYYWPSGSDWAGTTRDIWYRETLVAEGDPQHRSYCSGITWETFMRAWAEVDLATGGDGTLNGIAVDDLYDFRTDWYVRDLWGDGVGVAVENYGIGEVVTDWADVRPGDYVQIWRHSGSGHTFVFIDWLTDGEGAIEGVRYWSTQGSTDGIGYNEEYFGTSGSDIDPSTFFVARVYEPADWIPWR